jgi:acyl-CoA synthetase (AMP-forming)/AMP-acid ligase II/acyl carrier protein
MAESTPESFHPNCSTVVDALRWWSEEAPDRPAIAFLADGENETARLTYAELDREARQVAASLQQFMDPGSRALLCFAPGLDFVVAYLGCLYARVIAVPVYVPRNARHLGRLAAIAVDARAAVALADVKTARNVQAKQIPALAGLQWFVVEAFGTRATAPWRPPTIVPADIAFLQYTSGSTAAPKGVIVAHENLAANIRMLCNATGAHAGSLGVTWLPVHHDMGLIGGLLKPLWQGFLTVLMPPMSFTQEPVRWLRAISKYRATITVSPNFGYELCCRQVEAHDISQLDLSSLQVACIGAEPIRPETLQRFSRIFEPAGFHRSSFFPCYGLAEATLFASGHHLGSEMGISIDKASFELGKITPVKGEGAGRIVVSCGKSPTEQTVAIVDPETMHECPTDQAGEIWLAGDHIARGYWNNADATAANFGATLPTRSGTTFLRTGDLGFVRAGELFITGRLKDLIIVFGRNYFPQDIEATVETHTAIRIGGSVAFALTRDGSEGLGIVVEVEKDHLRGDLARVAEEVSDAVWEEHEVSVFQMVFLKPAGLPKTSSGKPRRGHTRDLILRNELAEIFRWPELLTSAGALRPVANTPGAATLDQHLFSLSPGDAEHLMLDLVRTEAAVVLGLASPSTIDAGQSLQSIGLDSFMALELRNRLSAVVGLALPVHLMSECGTINDLAQAVLARSLVQMTSLSIESGTNSSGSDDAYEQETL